MRVSFWIRTSEVGKASWRRPRQHRKEKAGGGQISVRWEVAGGRFINCFKKFSCEGEDRKKAAARGKEEVQGRFFLCLFIYLAVLGLRCGTWAPEWAGSVVAVVGFIALHHVGY